MGEKITIKTTRDIEILREGGRRLSYVLSEVAKVVKPGVSEIELDNLSERLIKDLGDKASFKNYKPHGAKISFPASICISVNEEVVHGIPGNRILVEGDIVGLDLGLEHDGMFTDMAVTVPVGNIDENSQKLIDVTKKSLEIGIKAIREGVSIGDVGNAIETFIKPYKFGIVRELSGHGLGYKIHEPPYVPNYGKKGAGLKLKEGMVIALEPMVNEGKDAIIEADDDFTVLTKDGKRSAHFEKTVVVTKNGVEILTPGFIKS
ncbi:MAG: type I methionyl aminopeptidase [bacterium]